MYHEMVVFAFYRMDIMMGGGSNRILKEPSYGCTAWACGRVGGQK